MSIIDLRQAQVRFENKLDRLISNREDHHKLRRDFIEYFNQKKLKEMSIDEFVSGKGKPKSGYNFCYTIERELDGLGRVTGSNAFKFGVYYGKTKSDLNDEYRFRKKFGKTYKEAFEKVRYSIIDLLDAGALRDSKRIVKNQLSPMFKGKILSTYYPGNFLNVFSDNHLNYFLTQLNLDSEALLNGDPVYKREALLDFKSRDKVMIKWSIDSFMAFLYTEYPGRPPRENSDSALVIGDLLSEYRIPNFPLNPKAEFIDLVILESKGKSNSKLNTRKGLANTKIDYEKESIKLKRIGDRGEKLVLDLEKKRLENLGRSDLASKVDQVSIESDIHGYDIKSFEADGTERLIEVKTTTSSIGPINFFLTENELRVANLNQNYYIYIVFEIMSQSPKICPVRNPFMSEDNIFEMTPIKYRVNINLSRA